MSTNQKRLTRRLVRDMFVILVVACATGIVVNLLHPRGFILVSRPELAARKTVPITSEEAKIKHDAGAIFVDAREKSEYDDAHIAGSINVPSLDAAGKMPGINFSFLDKPAEIVIYCDGPSCGAANALAETIRKRGYEKTLYIISQGLPEWEAKGYPVERGKQDGK